METAQQSNSNKLQEHRNQNRRMRKLTSSHIHEIQQLQEQSQLINYSAELLKLAKLLNQIN